MNNHSASLGVTAENGRLTDGIFLMGDDCYGVLVILLLNHVMHDVMYSLVTADILVIAL